MVATHEEKSAPPNPAAKVQTTTLKPRSKVSAIKKKSSLKKGDPIDRYYR